MLSNKNFILWVMFFSHLRLRTFTQKYTHSKEKFIFEKKIEEENRTDLITINFKNNGLGFKLYISHKNKTLLIILSNIPSVRLEYLAYKVSAGNLSPALSCLSLYARPRSDSTFPPLIFIHSKKKLLTLLFFACEPLTIFFSLWF